jgi:hypothetical protein
MHLDDRRRSARVPLATEVLLLDQCARPGGITTCDAGDLSTTGMLVYPRPGLNTGRTLRVFFPLRVGGHERWLDLDAFQAREARTTELYSWGLMFLHLSFLVSDLLGRYVDETLGRIAMGDERAAPFPGHSLR